MAEVRSKMSDVKSQVMEARGEPRPGTSGGFVGEELPTQHADLKPGELDLLERGAAARSRPCRHGEHHHGEHHHSVNANIMVMVSRCLLEKSTNTASLNKLLKEDIYTLLTLLFPFSTTF